MITDSLSRTWTPSADRSQWICSDGSRITTNPCATDAQVLACLESLISEPAPKTEAERIAELEAQVAQLISRLS